MRRCNKNVALMIGIPPGLIYGETADLEKTRLYLRSSVLTPLLKKDSERIKRETHNTKHVFERYKNRNCRCE